MSILTDFATILKNMLTSAASLFESIVNVLSANPLLLYIALFLGLSTGKSLQLGKVFKAKG